MPAAQSASHSSEDFSALASILRQVRRDYRGGRLLVQSIEETFAQREQELERLSRDLALDRSTASVRSPSPTVRWADPGIKEGHRLVVHLLGPFRLSVDGRAITGWPSSRAKLLFRYLVSYRQRRIPRDQLMEALWPEADPHASSNSLRVAVHALRQLLAADGDDRTKGAFILFEDGAYTWSSRLDFWVDVEQFERHWQAGRRLEKEGGWDEAVQEFEAAESLYQGDFLEDDPYEEWTLLRREALKDIQLALLAKLSERCFNLGDYEGCILRCQKILERDPCREDVYQWLMRCHARQGQMGRARHWYEMHVRILRQELDLSPSQQVVSLYRELLGGGDRA